MENVQLEKVESESNDSRAILMEKVRREIVKSINYIIGKNLSVNEKFLWLKKGQVLHFRSSQKCKYIKSIIPMTEEYLAQVYDIFEDEGFYTQFPQLTSMRHVEFLHIKGIFIYGIDVCSLEPMVFLDTPCLKWVNITKTRIVCVKALKKVNWPQIENITIEKNQMKQLEVSRGQFWSSKQGIFWRNHKDYFRFDVDVIDVCCLVKIQSPMLLNLSSFSYKYNHIEQKKVHLKLVSRFISWYQQRIIKSNNRF